MHACKAVPRVGQRPSVHPGGCSHTACAPPLAQVGFINWHKGEQLDVDEYEHYEQVSLRGGGNRTAGAGAGQKPRRLPPQQLCGREEPL